MGIIDTLRGHTSRLMGDQTSLYGKIVRSGSWVTAGHVVEIALRLGSSLILTRLLSPAAFGIMATAQVFLYTATMLSDVGIRSLVITHEDSDDPTFLRTVWTFQALRGAVLAAITAGTGYLLAIAQGQNWLSERISFSEPVLPGSVAALGISFVCEGFKSTNEYVLARDLRQEILVMINVVTKICGTFLTVAIVYWTLSVWGFVYAILLTAALRASLSLFLIPGIDMKPALDREYLRQLVTRGKWLGLNSWTTLVYNTADKVVLGAVFGSQFLGIYTLANTLVEAVRTLLMKVTSSIVLPTVVKVLENGQNASTNLKKLKTVINASHVLMFVAIGVGGPAFVLLAYDARYAGAAVIASILALRVLYAANSVNVAIFERLQDFRFLAINSAWRAGVVLAALYGFASYGYVYLAIAAYASGSLLSAIFAIRRLVTLPFIDKRYELVWLGVFVALLPAPLAAYYLLESTPL